MVDTSRRQSDALKSAAWARFGLKMESSENNERQSSDNQQSSDSVSAKPTSESSDYNYDDDFEELDSFIQEKSQNSSSNSATVTNSTENSRKDVFHKSNNSDSDSQVEKGQHETSGAVPKEKTEKPAGEDSTDSGHGVKSASAFDDPQSDDSEPEPEGDVMFTEDQQRAMMELMAQKHASGDYSDDPPEYDVKERLKELNAELAMEPDPDDRQHRVGFKEELVDLVAPPPEVSDDDDSPRKALTGTGDGDSGDKAQAGDKKKQFVVERDGKFDVVADHELTSSERAMFNISDDSSGPKEADSSGGSGKSAGAHQAGGRVNINNSSVSPAPPSKPRPNTASGYSRRSTRPAQSPRPQTASSNRYAGSSSSSSALQNFNYTSKYAMSPSEKERAAERARLKEEQRKREEEQRQQEEDYKRQEAEDAFQAWLRQKTEEYRKRRQEGENRKDKDGRDDKSDDSEEGYAGYPCIPYLEPFEPIVRLKAKENDEAFKGWLKIKQAQTKREKLLKKREEQEIKDGYYVRSRDECEQAYKEWLKKKYTELKRQRTAEKQRVRSLRTQAKKSRKQQMMARAVRQSQAFRYVDYYGYRF